VGNQIQPQFCQNWARKSKVKMKTMHTWKKKKKEGVEQGVMSMHALHLYGL
jgi:hypothetical protein